MVDAHSEIEAVSLVQHMAIEGDDKMIEAKDFGMDFVPSSVEIYK
jgi:hypothetical protein